MTEQNLQILTDQAQKLDLWNAEINPLIKNCKSVANQLPIRYIEFLKSKINERPQCAIVALLIWMKFENSELYYNSDHFRVKINDKFYDWDGEHEEQENYLPFNSFGEDIAISHYNAIQNHFKNTTK